MFDRILIGAYFVGSTIPFASLLLFLAWPIGHLVESLGIDDAWLLLTLPLGAAIGISVAPRTMRSRRFHLVTIAISLLIAAFFFWESWRLDRLADSLLGVRGPFSGLAESVGSLATFVYAFFALMSAAIGFFGLFLASRYTQSNPFTMRQHVAVH